MIYLPATVRSKNPSLPVRLLDGDVSGEVLWIASGVEWERGHYRGEVMKLPLDGGESPVKAQLSSWRRAVSLAIERWQTAWRRLDATVS